MSFGISSVKIGNENEDINMLSNFYFSERIASTTCTERSRNLGGGFALSLVDMRTDVADKNADYHQISQD
ncbi:MAG: hypothetical protein JXL97_01960, partial [Bacteroidales bacterium]|nr:hypothetical protein [Bacteroidales bacterium]